MRPARKHYAGAPINWVNGCAKMNWFFGVPHEHAMKMEPWCLMRNIAILRGRGLTPDAARRANPNTYEGLRTHIRKCMQALCENDSWPEPPKWEGIAAISPACEAIAAIHAPSTETPAIRVILMQVIKARAKWYYGAVRSSKPGDISYVNQFAAIRELGTQAVLHWHESLRRRYAAANVCKKAAKRAPSAEKACSEIQAELEAELMSALDLALPDIHGHMFAKSALVSLGPAPVSLGSVPVAFEPAPVAFKASSGGTQATANVAVDALARVATNAAPTNVLALSGATNAAPAVTHAAVLVATDAATIATDAAPIATDAAPAVTHAAVLISINAATIATGAAGTVAHAAGAVAHAAATVATDAAGTVAHVAATVATDAAGTVAHAAGAVAHAAVTIASNSAVSDAVSTAASVASAVASVLTSVASAIGGVIEVAADCLSAIDLS